MGLKVLGCLALLTLPASAQKHEVGLTLGRLLESKRSSGDARLTIGMGTALQANYGFRFFGTPTVAVYGEMHMLASPLRGIASPLTSVTRDIATLFLTPGVRLKFLPHSRVSPYAALGAGYAVFEQSTAVLGGTPNPAPREAHRGVIDFGGGIDFPIWKFVGGRLEVRDFYSGSPSFNLPALRGGQHNVVAGGGIVLRFR